MKPLSEEQADALHAKVVLLDLKKVWEENDHVETVSRGYDIDGRLYELIFDRTGNYFLRAGYDLGELEWAP